MILNIEKKKKLVEKISNFTKKAQSAIIINFSKITANEINSLRKKSSKKDIIIKIIKNTLLKISIKNTKFECLKKKIKGPTLIAYSIKHPGSAARLFKKFEKKNPNFKSIVGSFEGKIISTLELSTMPTYKESIIKLINFLKEICIIRLIKIINIIKNKKQNKIIN
ncbi:50S ribosomal protein L10 [Buchnera aphidicola (Pseudoregma panicola)]|uniref:50S ribosomal protein L10 n=1 Tax=Buchnera aphidicola TaxID=9 RepID=UPI0031B7234B